MTDDTNPRSKPLPEIKYYANDADALRNARQLLTQYNARDIIAACIARKRELRNPPSQPETKK